MPDSLQRSTEEGEAWLPSQTQEQELSAQRRQLENLRKASRVLGIEAMVLLEELKLRDMCSTLLVEDQSLDRIYSGSGPSTSPPTTPSSDGRKTGLRGGRTAGRPTQRAAKLAFSSPNMGDAAVTGAIAQEGLSHRQRRFHASRRTRHPNPGAVTTSMKHSSELPARKGDILRYAREAIAGRRAAQFQEPRQAPAPAPPSWGRSPTVPSASAVHQPPATPARGVSFGLALQRDRQRSNSQGAISFHASEFGTPESIRSRSSRGSSSQGEAPPYFSGLGMQLAPMQVPDMPAGALLMSPQQKRPSATLADSLCYNSQLGWCLVVDTPPVSQMLPPPVRSLLELTWPKFIILTLASQAGISLFFGVAHVLDSMELTKLLPSCVGTMLLQGILVSVGVLPNAVTGDGEAQPSPHGPVQVLMEVACMMVVGMVCHQLVANMGRASPPQQRLDRDPCEHLPLVDLPPLRRGSLGTPDMCAPLSFWGASDCGPGDCGYGSSQFETPNPRGPHTAEPRRPRPWNWPRTANSSRHKGHRSRRNSWGSLESEESGFGLADEVPTLDELLHGEALPPYSLEAFQEFATIKLLEENIEFCLEVQRFRACFDTQIPKFATRLLDNFVRPGSVYEVNLSSQVRTETLAEVNHCVQWLTEIDVELDAERYAHTLQSCRKAFDKAEAQILALLSMDAYPRYLNQVKEELRMANEVLAELALEDSGFGSPLRDRAMSSSTGRASASWSGARRFTSCSQDSTSSSGDSIDYPAGTKSSREILLKRSAALQERNNIRRALATVVHRLSKSNSSIIEADWDSPPRLRGMSTGAPGAAPTSPPNLGCLQFEIDPTEGASGEKAVRAGYLDMAPAR